MGPPGLADARMPAKARCLGTLEALGSLYSISRVGAEELRDITRGRKSGWQAQSPQPTVGTPRKEAQDKVEGRGSLLSMLAAQYQVLLGVKGMEAITPVGEDKGLSFSSPEFHILFLTVAPRLVLSCGSSLSYWMGSTLSMWPHLHML